MTWPTQSVPALVDKANWNGEHTVSTVLPNCRAKHLATSLLKAIPVAIPLTPPSGFCNAVMVATMSTRPTVDGTVPLARSSLAENNKWNNPRSSKQTRSISLVHPPGPGEQPAGASRRHFANAFESNWRGLAGWKSNTSRGIADTGFYGRRP